ncbi:ribosomal protein L4 domain-containing protein, partial [Gorgonomyces haynaldii]
LNAWLENFENGNRVGLVELNRNVFGQELRQDIVSRVLRYEESWFAQGTESTKALGQVRGSTRKPFPQKGRGKARVGTLRAPQFKGGYTVHGPRPHNKAQDIQQKVYDLGIKVALSAKFAQNELRIVDRLQSPGYSKKDLYPLLDSMGLRGKKVFFMYGGIEPDLKLLRALDEFTERENEQPMILTCADQVSVRALLDHEVVVMEKEALEQLEEIYACQ